MKYFEPVFTELSLEVADMLLGTVCVLVGVMLAVGIAAILVINY